MLRQLSIRDVVLIDRLDLDFEPGLGVLTGETGAGPIALDPCPLHGVKHKPDVCMTCEGLAS